LNQFALFIKQCRVRRRRNKKKKEERRNKKRTSDIPGASATATTIAQLISTTKAVLFLRVKILSLIISGVRNGLISF
jgi:hypothetical protein